MAFRLERDAGGVEGLHLAHNLFSERVERALFEAPAAGGVPVAAEGSPNGAGYLDATTFGDEIFQVINAARDCGLCPGLPAPDRAICRVYRPRTGGTADLAADALNRTFFRGGLPTANSGVLICDISPSSLLAHYDDCHQIGEIVLGVSLGAACVLELTPGEDATGPRGPLRGRRPVRVLLPRRSAYILSGLARYPPGWKHGIEAVGADQEKAPAWNPLGERRSLTLRSSMAHAVLTLSRELECLPASTLPATRDDLQRRLQQLRAKHRAGRASGLDLGSAGGLLALAPQAAVDAVLRSGRAAARLPAPDAPFTSLLTPELAQLYSGGGGGSASGSSTPCDAATPAVAGGAAAGDAHAQAARQAAGTAAEARRAASMAASVATTAGPPGTAGAAGAAGAVLEGQPRYRCDAASPSAAQRAEGSSGDEEALALRCALRASVLEQQDQFAAEAEEAELQRALALSLADCRPCLAGSKRQREEGEEEAPGPDTRAGVAARTFGTARGPREQARASLAGSDGSVPAAAAPEQEGAGEGKGQGKRAEQVGEESEDEVEIVAEVKGCDEGLWLALQRSLAEQGER